MVFLVCIILNKVWRLFFNDNELVISESEMDKESLKTLHVTIKKSMRILNLFL